MLQLTSLASGTTTADVTSNLSALWLIVGAALVLLMTPGVAFFYGGMVRAKSVISMMMMSFGAIAVVAVLWVLFGYGMSFGTDWIIPHFLLNPFSNVGLRDFLGIASDGAMATDNVADTYSLAFVGLPGHLRDHHGRADLRRHRRPRKFGAWMIFAAVWVTIVYFPVAYWVFNFTVNATGS